MRSTIIVCTALGAALLAAGPGLAALPQATHHHAHAAKAPATVVAREYAMLDRVCDWVGPGGRAVYVCRSVHPQPVAEPPPPPHHRTCDWVGPGGRAIYLCR